MNRKRSVALGAVALTAPLAGLLSAPALAAPAQFCQHSCHNSGYRYVLDRVVSGVEPGEVDPIEFFCLSDAGDREVTDSLDADQSAAALATAFALDGSPVVPEVKILTDNRGRPVGFSLEWEFSKGSDPNGFEFQMVCLDDRGSVSPPV